MICFLMSPLEFLVKLDAIILAVWFKLLYCFIALGSCMLSRCTWLPVVFGIRCLCGTKFIATAYSLAYK